MEAEIDSRVHFSESVDPWSNSRHAEVLQSLIMVEKKLVTSLRIVATAMNHVSPKKTSEENATVSFNKSSTEFLQLLKEIHEELATHIHLVSDYRVYGRSTYGIEKKMSLSRERAKIIFEQLKGISNYLDENCIPGEETSNA